MPLLELRGITMQFGGLKAVDNLSFSIEKGQLGGLIGPNGAGKTTAFNTLTGVYRPTLGDVLLDGQSVVGLKPYQICQRGLARTFQNIRLFRDLTVLQNVLIASHLHIGYSMADAVRLSARFTREEKIAHDKAMDLLHIFNMEGKANEISSSLPYGEQRKLEIVRALATNPKMILLDEPAAGMNHSETHGLMETIAKIRKDFDLTVLLIEHDMKLVMGICEKIIVLDHGTKIEEGDSERVRNSKTVIEAYLGAEEEH